MRDMFTKKPDEGCREVEAGIFARPVQTSEESKMLKLGWSYSITSQRGNDNGIRKDEEEGREEEVEVRSTIGKAYASAPIEIGMYTERELLVEKYEAKFGKKPHHKMKVDTILKHLEQSDDQS